MSQEKFFNIINNSKIFAYDVETNGLSWKKQYVCGYSVSDGKDAVYIPVRHALDRGGDGNIDGIDNFEKHLAECIYKHQGKIVGHNIKFDNHFGENHGIKIGNKQKDTMIRAALCNENKFSYSLANCAKEYPDIVQKKGKELYEHISQLVGCKPDSNSMGHFHMLSGADPLASDYAATDTLTTMQLYNRQEEQIYKENLDVVEGMESELSYVLQKMERKGIKIDVDAVPDMKRRIGELQMEAYQHIPLKEDFQPINVRSNKDLQEYFLLCEIDDWPFTQPTERHPTGQPSFAKDFLEKHEEGLYIVNARKFDMLMATFVEPMEGFIHNGRIHCNYNQTRGEFGGAKPGRLSCYDPNLQQVPKRDIITGEIYRRIFVAEPDFYLVEFDHSQAEPRLYAHYSDEPSLIDGYKRTPFIDMHTIAAQMMNIARGDAKHINLGIMYGMGYKKLAKKLKLSEQHGKELYYRWHRTFTKVSDFTKMAARVGENRGYVRTILGRRARLTDNNFSYRMANRIIQGSSADILKWKMCEINRWIERNKYDDVVHMLLNIHDALLFQVHKDYTHLIPQIQDIFQSVLGPPFNLKVPFYADYHMGKDWAEASYGKH